MQVQVQVQAVASTSTREQDEGDRMKATQQAKQQQYLEEVVGRLRDLRELCVLDGRVERRLARKPGVELRHVFVALDSRPERRLDALLAHRAPVDVAR